MKKLFSVISSAAVASFLAAPADAQGFRRPSPGIILPPPVVIHVPKDMKPITISNMDINVEILANVAVTTYDITFKNPNSRVLEGEFDFAMTEGQSVSAFALDINGSMRDGVVVEKAKGRQVFEAIVRRGVDPGLIEKTSDNHFKARIYPFFANGSRRVQIKVEEKLKIDNGSFYYKLPLNFNQEIASFSLNAEVIKQSLKPLVKESPLNNFNFKSWNDSYTASFKEKDYTLYGDLSFAIPVENKEKVFTYTDSGKTYFFATLPVALKEGKALNPKKITILWDSSSSAGKGNKEREIALLENYFKEVKNVNVDFISFNIKKADTKTFKIKGSKWDDLKKEIEGIAYDGGTNLKTLENFKTNSDLILLFTDGLDSFGQKFEGAFKTKTFTVNSANGFNAGFLNKAAAASGGEFLNLAETSARHSVNLLARSVYKLTGIDYKTSDFEDVFPAVPTVIDGRVSLSGILKKKEGELVLNFGFDTTGESTKKITIKKDSNDNALAKNIWAQDKLRYLSLDAEDNKKEIIDISKEYGVVTEFTSLIVLEEIMDYVNNEIVPPSELLEQYNTLLADKRRRTNDKEKNVLEAAVREFETLKKWWDRDFPKDKPSFAGERNRASGTFGGGFSSPMAMMKSSSANKAMKAESMATDSMVFEDASIGSAPAAAMQEAESSAKMKEVSSHADGKAASVKLEAWQSNAPYMKDLKKASSKDAYDVYLKLKKDNEARPSFYLDVASFFQDKGDTEKAILIVSNTSEMKVDNPDLLRITAQKLLELGEKDFAVSLFKYVVDLREESPQVVRDLAFAQMQNGQYQAALDNYYKIIKGDWTNNYDGIKTVVFGEMNNLISLHGGKLDLSGIDKRFIYEMPVDVRIVLTWSAPGIYVDLHVTDTYGEEASYRHNLTYTGGKISRDITNGYGPQEFMIKNAIEGDYKTYLNYYGGSSQTILGPVVAYADIYTFYGTSKQTHVRKIVSLEKTNDKTDLVVVDFKAPKKEKAPRVKPSEDPREAQPVQKAGIVDTMKGFFGN